MAERRLGRLWIAAVIALGALAGDVRPARAVTVPDGYAVQTVAGGLNRPTRIAASPDGRIFIAQQDGQVRVVRDGALLTQPFATVSTLTGGERGLTGLALDPGFPSAPYVYLYYTVAGPPPRNRVSRFTARGDLAFPGSETVLVDLDPLGAPEYHNGGALRFGPDGRLYIATGDAGSAPNAQRMDSRHGKLLRLNPDGSIPPDNPFAATATGANRAIWALGLRNPFSMAFDNAGRLFINDVGNAAWEEINEGLAGANYGWPLVEGPSTDPRFRAPLLAYPHQGGSFNGCAIAGAAPHQFPNDPPGAYYFSDYCRGWLRRFDPATGRSTAFASDLGENPVDVTPAPSGGLYVLLYGPNGQGPRGQLRRIWHTGSLAPLITEQPASLTVPAGGAAEFIAEAYGAAPLSYRWQRNGADIAGATSAAYRLAAVSTADDDARFRVMVSNAAGAVTSQEARLTVTRNGLPAVQITTPAAGARYRAGERINWSAVASDPDDGVIPPTAFTWWVDFHHDTHAHPFILPTGGATSGSFTIPDEGETATNVWYRLYVSVRDQAGVMATTARDVHPHSTTITFTSVPIGLLLTVDGRPLRAPFQVESVTGMKRTAGAVTPQAHDGVNYEFLAWSDGGAATHAITTPDSGATLTVTYAPAAPTIPHAPSGLHALSTGAAGNHILWQDNAANEDTFQVVWSRSAPIAWNVVDLPGDTEEWTHTPVTTDRSYFYFVRSCNVAGCSGWSPGLRIDYSVPVAPAGLRAEVVTETTVELRWENTPVDEQSIEVAWTAASPVAYHVIELAPDVTATTLAGLSPGTRYWVHIRACNLLGCSDWSGGIETVTSGGTPPPLPSQVRAGAITATSIEVQWDGPVAGATALQSAWTRADAITYQFATIAPEATAWTLTGAVAGRSYYFHLRACNGGGCSGWTGALTVTTPGDSRGGSAPLQLSPGAPPANAPPPAASVRAAGRAPRPPEVRTATRLPATPPPPAVPASGRRTR